jgi:hypothetical protein
MSCPICDQKSANCDCTSKEKEWHSELSVFQLRVERLQDEVKKLKIRFTHRILHHILLVDSGSLNWSSIIPLSTQDNTFQSGFSRADLALDLIYDTVDTMMENGELMELDEILKEALNILHESKLSLNVALGLLTITLPVKTRLPHRYHFFTAIMEELKARRGEDAAKSLLNGLE